MSQQFSSDAQMLSTTVNLPTTTETAVLTCNPVHGPYGTCKMVIEGLVILTTGAGTTGIQIRVRRNPSGENVVLNPSVITLPIGAAVNGAFPFQFTDQLSDGRDCTYQVSIQQVAAGGNGTALQGTAMTATCISG